MELNLKRGVVLLIKTYWLPSSEVSLSFETALRDHSGDNIKRPLDAINNSSHRYCICSETLL
jgi:hypothetical protein